MEAGSELSNQELVDAIMHTPPPAPPPIPPPGPATGSTSTTVTAPASLLTSVPAPFDSITKTVHHNARHKMTPKKPVVIQKCEICNIELTGQVVIDAHMKGSKHAKKLKAKELLSSLIDAGQIRVDGSSNDNKSGIFKCDLCNVSLNSTQQLEVHNAGAKHHAKLSERGGEQAVQDGPIATQSDTSAEGPNDFKGPSYKSEKPKGLANPLDLVCTVCNITVNSPQQLEQHLNSKKHQDREAGRSALRPTPYPARGSRGARGNRGGLGSHGRGGGGKANSAKYTSLSNSFKSAGYTNSFIKPEGGVTMPANCGTSKGPPQSVQSQAHGGKGSNFGSQYKNRGNFGSLTPYVNTDNVGRGGFNPRGGASRGGWNNPAAGYGAPPVYSGYDYEQYGYGYSGYETSDGYGGYGMMPSGPPPSY